MTQLDEKTVLLLRYLHEHNHTTWMHGFKRNDMKAFFGMEEGELRQFENSVRTMGLITATSSDSGYWLTPQGREYLRREMDERVPLSLDAERVLNHLRDIYPKGGYEGEEGVERDSIIEVLSLDDDRYDAALQQLADADLVESNMLDADILDWDVRITKLGRKLVQDNFKRPRPTATTHIGQQFNASVTATNMINAFDSVLENIRQTATENDLAAMGTFVDRMLGQLAASLPAELDLQTRRAVTDAIGELQAEFQKPDKTATSIHRRIIGLLDFGDKLNGTVSLGILFAPYVPMLYEAAKQFLQR
jgi:hypothetical protein